MKKIIFTLILLVFTVDAKILVAVCTNNDARNADAVLHCTGDYDPKKESDSPTIRKMYKLGWKIKTSFPVGSQGIGYNSNVDLSHSVGFIFEKD